MYIVKSKENRLFQNKSLLIFLISQGISNFGDALRFIAITTLLVRITGSGLSAGIGLAFSVIPNILLSLFAGSVGDILPGKYLLIAIELVRGAVIILFINNNNIIFIYILLMVLSSLDSVYNPPLRKVMVNILGEKEVLPGNSILNGVSGITSILGSALAGILIGFWGIQSIFLINSYSHAISAALLIFIKLKKSTLKADYNKKGPYISVYKDIKSGFNYLKNMGQVREIIFASMIVCFGTISTNMAFYPFAFDVLKVTGKGWGFMMSIFYGANLCAMIISLWLNRRIKRPGMLLVYVTVLIVSAIWFFYGMIENLLVVLLMQLIEGTSLSLYSIFLISELQLITRENFMARITGINDFINGIGKTFGIVYAYAVINMFSTRQVFIMNSLILSVYTLYKLLFHQSIFNKSKFSDHSIQL